MKNKKLKYIKNRAVPFTELAGVPLFVGKAINRLIKNEKISDTLDNIVKISKENASSYNDISNIELMKFQTEYKKAENFFAKYFVKYEDSPVESRIEYCLEEYKTEVNKISSASNSLVLEENFLKGAERTLMLYYILKERNLIEGNRLKQQEASKQEIEQLELKLQEIDEKRQKEKRLEQEKVDQQEVYQEEIEKLELKLQKNKIEIQEQKKLEQERLEEREVLQQKIDQYERHIQENEEKKSEKERLGLLKIEEERLEEEKRIRKFKKENSLELLFEKPEEYLIFRKILNSYFSKQNKLVINTTLIAGVLIELKDIRCVIKSRYKSEKVTDKQLVDGMKATFDFTIPKSTFSTARANFKIDKGSSDEVLSFIEPFL